MYQVNNKILQQQLVWKAGFVLYDQVQNEQKLFHRILSE